MNEVAESSNELSKMQRRSGNPAEERCLAEGSVTCSCWLPSALGPHPRQLLLKQLRRPDLMEDEAAVPAKP